MIAGKYELSLWTGLTIK